MNDSLEEVHKQIKELTEIVKQGRADDVVKGLFVSKEARNVGYALMCASAVVGVFLGAVFV